MSASEKPPLELGSTYRRAELNVSAFRACYSYEKQVDWLLAHDAEVINRVRPQIEAEARAAEIEDAIAAIRKRAECTLSDALEVADAVDAISALATSPAGHVCVPVGLLDAVNALLHQIDIGAFSDEHGHSAKMLKSVHDLMRTLAARPK